mmetsp:Transcript_31911/g.70313  ORF Transcript_31911/g.70313 Transcript_31911/m.70313 type:complete len:358 (-) Transcript_31911:379-1452(-)
MPPAGVAVRRLAVSVRVLTAHSTLSSLSSAASSMNICPSFLRSIFCSNHSSPPSSVLRDTEWSRIRAACLAAFSATLRPSALSLRTESASALRSATSAADSFTLGTARLRRVRGPPSEMRCLRLSTNSVLLKCARMEDCTLLRYSGSVHFSRIFSLMRDRHSGVRSKLWLIIFSRNSGSSHRAFSVADMRARTSAVGALRSMSRYSLSCHLSLMASLIRCLVSSEWLRVPLVLLAYVSLKPGAFQRSFIASDMRLRPSSVRPPLSFSLRTTSLPVCCRASNSASEKPSAAALSPFLRKAARRVFSEILARVSAECCLPTFQGVLPLLAAEILALLDSVCGRPRAVGGARRATFFPAL